jgi:hypothetical protein
VIFAPHEVEPRYDGFQFDSEKRKGESWRIAFDVTGDVGPVFAQGQKVGKMRTQNDADDKHQNTA